MTTNQELNQLLSLLPHKLQVEFALYCAKDVLHLVREEDQAIVGNAIRVTELWLKDKATADECCAASDAVYAAYAAHAAHAAAYAASHETKMKEYLDYLKEMIQSMPEVERLLLGVNI